MSRLSSPPSFRKRLGGGYCWFVPRSVRQNFFGWGGSWFGLGAQLAFRRRYFLGEIWKSMRKCPPPVLSGPLSSVSSSLCLSLPDLPYPSPLFQKQGNPTAKRGGGGLSNLRKYAKVMTPSLSAAARIGIFGIVLAKGEKGREKSRFLKAWDEEKKFPLLSLKRKGSTNLYRHFSLWIPFPPCLA